MLGKAHASDPDCRLEDLVVVARRPLRAFHDESPEARRLLLHSGRESSVRDGVRVMPCEEFLRGVTPGEPLPGTAE